MMLLGKDFDEFFAGTIQAIRPYLGDIVCLGGCANLLYRFHDLASDVNWGYLGTMDVDMGVPQELELSERPPMAELMKNAGYRELTCGDANEAVIKYGPGDEDSAVDLEFLCGKSGLSKKDQASAAYPVQDGLYAQPLRYLELSLHNAWDISLGRVPGFEHLQGTSVRVPNPAAYVVSKILIRDEQRKPKSMNKDCFYIYEVSVIFRDAREAIREEYDRLEPCASRWKKRFAETARTIFSSETAEGPVSAARVYRDLGALSGEEFPVTEEMVFRSVDQLLSAMLD
jgi:hypothetical protein